MSYQFYNAHPKGLLVNDCVKRAITKATGMDYMEVQRELNRHKKVTGAKSYNSDYNPHHYVETVLHGKKLSFPAVKGQPRMNGQRFCEAYKTGRYILNMAGHWSCCVDGVIYDTWNPSEKCVYTAYKVEECIPHYYKMVGNSICVYNENKSYCYSATSLDARKGFIEALKMMGFEQKK